MTIKFLLPMTFALALAACGGTSAAWVKEGASPEQMRADQSACRSQAERALGPSERFTDDIRGTTRGGRAETRQIVSSTRDLKVARTYDRLFARCMVSRGYLHPKT
tara:strand:+ start:905 stop:1222 length:318 start_codon:yes stop_codon:yes gene_type:complete